MDDMSKLTSVQRLGHLIVRKMAKVQAGIHEVMIGEPVWRSSDGVIWPIRKMEEGHLVNAIKMLERRGEKSVKLEQLREEFKRRHPPKERVIREKVVNKKKIMGEIRNLVVKQVFGSSGISGGEIVDIVFKMGRERGLEPEEIEKIISSVLKRCVGVYDT